MNEFIRVPSEYALDFTLDGLDMNSKDLSILRPRKEFDWDDFYRQGTPMWDTGLLEPDLKRLVEKNALRPCSALELGCGSGIEAIYLAKKRFDVTAVDCSAMAIDRAQSRARRHNALLRIVHEDVFRFCSSLRTPFDFVYDIGFYHFIRQNHLTAFIDLLWKVTHSGSYYFTLAGSDEEEFDEAYSHQNFLPTVSRDEVFNELGTLFEVVEIRKGTIYSRIQENPFKAWACLFRRP
ncbi:MAG: class I SAM-dependent methyltransferase [Planctomycetia bacterium]|nr:class I SAM-dependent methyltransferase [Planctomycetia bacterium]